MCQTKQVRFIHSKTTLAHNNNLCIGQDAANYKVSEQNYGYHDMAYYEMFAYIVGNGIPKHTKSLPTLCASASQPWRCKAMDALLEFSVG